MPVTRRSRALAATPEAVWAIVADPHHQARWWPRVRRVEDVRKGRWTQVLMTEKGKGVRADFRLLESERPRRLRWAQELEGTPFEGILDAAETEVVLAAPGDGDWASGAATNVTIELRQRLRGWARLGAFLFRRAAARQLDEALAALAEIVPAADR